MFLLLSYHSNNYNNNYNYGCHYNDNQNLLYPAY